jgi:DNA-binding transcriptional regulator GbsR (MarR family)
MSQSAQLPPELLHDPPADPASDPHTDLPTAPPNDTGDKLPADAPNDEEVSRAVERMASRFVTMGVPRMPSRVFFAIMASPKGALTANEICERLSVSPAAVSKAVQYLVQTHLVHREYVPGARRDRYLVGVEQWSEVFASRAPSIQAMAGDITEAVRVLGGEDTGPGARLAEMRDFLLFTLSEMDAVFDRWLARRAEASDRPPE